MFDPTKPVQTRDGRKVRIIATDVKADQPIVAIVDNRNGTQDVMTFGVDGSYRVSRTETCFDLQNIPVRREGWVNVYRPDHAGERYFGAVAATEKEATGCAMPSRIATVRVEWEE